MLTIAEERVNLFRSFANKLSELADEVNDRPSMTLETRTALDLRMSGEAVISHVMEMTKEAA